MHGFFLIDKPKGITSQGVVNFVKKKFNLHKCGHTGTLDPNTTGLLVVGCDEATKMMKLVNEHDKTYVTTIVFGYDSNTLDITGDIIDDIKMNFTLLELDKALEELKHQNEQIPPMVSAIKINGKKLYEYERKGVKLELVPRDIKIYDLKRLSDLRMVDDHLEIDLEISCSKGFYVRSFARDLGLKLGGCAIMKELRRIKSGEFDVSKAVTLNEITSADLLKIEDIFTDFDKIEVNDYLANLAKNGVIFDERQIKTDKPFYVFYKNEIIAIYEVFDTYRYKPLIIFKK